MYLQDNTPEKNPSPVAKEEGDDHRKGTTKNTNAMQDL